MTTFDTDVFGAAGGGGTGVVKYRPGLMVEYGDEVKSLKDLEVYVRWSKEPEVLTLNVDPADDWRNFKSVVGLCPIGSTTPYIKSGENNITRSLVRYKGGLYVFNSSFNDEFTKDFKNTEYQDVVDDTFIQKLTGPDNGYAFAGEPFYITSDLFADRTPNKTIIFYTPSTTTGDDNASGITTAGFYKTDGNGIQLLKAEAWLSLSALACLDESTHFYFTYSYGVNRVYVTRDNFATVTEIFVDKSSTTIQVPYILSFVKTTSGRFFLSLGWNSGASTYTPDGDISTYNLNYPFFYELVFDENLTTATLLGISQPLETPDPENECLVGQVELCAIKENKIAVLFSVRQTYIYDVDTNTFTETNKQAKDRYNTGFNHSIDRRTLKGYIAYDHINDMLYTLTTPGRADYALTYLKHDLRNGTISALELSSQTTVSSSYYYHFGGFFCKDGSLFGNLNISTAGDYFIATQTTNQIPVTAGMVFVNTGLKIHPIKNFQILHNNLSRENGWVVKIGNRYDEISYITNTFRELTTTQHHMNYDFAHRQYSYYSYILEEYMFRIF